MPAKKKGSYANIHAKRSTGKTMQTGAKGALPQDFKNAAKTAKKRKTK